MPWGYAAGAAVGLIGDSMKSDANGGAGTSTKEPWKAAEPWLLQNLASGQALQDQYTAQPFSAQQTTAYNNQYGLNDYVRNLVPGLLGQISGQQVGFDRSNPTAKVSGFNFGAGATGSGSGSTAGLLSNMGQSPMLGVTSAPSTASAPAASPLSTFIQQQGGAANSMTPTGMGTTGGFGSFQYGAQPQPGTQAYKDMSDYFAQGGVDPSNLYGRGAIYQQERA